MILKKLRLPKEASYLTKLSSPIKKLNNSAPIKLKKKSYIIASGDIGYPTPNMVKWKLSSNGMFKIYGSGDVVDDAYKSWSTVKAFIKSATIEDPVTPSSMLGWFTSCINLSAIDFLIKDSVTNIDFIFARCSNLSNLPRDFSIPDSVTSMYLSFGFCSNLSSLPNGFSIPDSVTNIDSAFAFCSSLSCLPENFSIGSPITSMDSTFAFCSNLRFNETLNL